MYRKANVCIETLNGLLIVDGWELKDRDWNGWAIPFFDKTAADAIATEIGLTYIPETDSYKETEQSAGDTDEFEQWSGGLNQELGVHVYAIGAMSWCWDTIESDDIKDLSIKLIDRRQK